jgi:hypothetical protein
MKLTPLTDVREKDDNIDFIYFSQKLSQTDFTPQKPLFFLVLCVLFF